MSQQYRTPSVDSTSQDRSADTAARASATPDADLLGNQASLEDAGLAAGQDSCNNDLLDSCMASVVLDAQPLDVALPQALAHLDNPAVGAWINGQELPDVVRTMVRLERPETAAWWPIGVGVESEVDVGASVMGGAGLTWASRVVRSGEDALDLQLSGDATVSLGGSDAAGASVSDGWGDKAVGAGMGIGGTAVLHDTATTSIEFDLVDVALASAAASALLPLDLVLSGRDARVDDARRLGIDDRVLVLADDLSFWDHVTSLEMAASAGAGADIDVPGLLDMGIGVDELLSELRQLSALVELGAGVGVRAEVGEVDGHRLVLNASASGAAQLASTLAELGLGPVDQLVAAFDSLSATYGADALVEVSLELGAALDFRSPGLPQLGSLGQVRIMRGSSRDDVSRTDTVCFSVADLLGISAGECAADSASTGATTLADAALSYPSLAWSRTVEAELDPAALDGVLPDLLQRVMGVVDGFVATSVDKRELFMRGTADVAASVIQTAALATDLALPAGMTAVAALQDVAAAIAAVRFGGPVSPWLAPVHDALSAAAQLLPDLADARLMGRVGLAVGGEADAMGTGAKAAANSSMIVDTALAPEELVALQQRVGAGG